MNQNKKISTISKIVGTLVESKANAAEALIVLDQVKNTYLERCWHITTSVECSKKSSQVAATTSEEKNEMLIKIEIPEGISQKDAIKQLQKHVSEMVRDLPIDF